MIEFFAILIALLLVSPFVLAALAGATMMIGIVLAPFAIIYRFFNPD